MFSAHHLSSSRCRFFGALAFILVAGCGGPTDDTSNTANNAEGGVVTPTALAFRKLNLGDADPTAWRSLGENLDGLVSDLSSEAHCALHSGAAPAFTKPDGENGIDNSFGANLMRMIQGVTPNPSGAATAPILAGKRTWIIVLSDLGAEPSQASISGAYYAGSDCGGSPTWSGSDVWPITNESVADADASKPLVVIPQSQLENGAWTSGTNRLSAALPLTIVVYGVDFPIWIHQARITMQLSGQTDSAQATHGIISGVLETEEFVETLRQLFGTKMGACQGQMIDWLVSEVRDASDIVKDGTNGDPSKSCDGISIGVGFEASAVALGPVAPPANPMPHPCN